ncbi:MAG: hypothetical protein JRM86_06195 [Nitrososphaerota archaeon]|nr:hypothetical protein [Nitrososphaerota archaeon]MDG7021403.1 hypothetical protein [Nitrososphaerota archaeon]
MHHAAGRAAKCALCGREESTPDTFPTVIGVGRVCLACGMGTVKCAVCGGEVKRLTSSRFQGRDLCLKDHMKEVEKYKQHIVKTFDEDDESVKEILGRSLSDAPEGYSLVTVRRARNSMHVWEAEYEKTEILQSRCS